MLEGLTDQTFTELKDAISEYRIAEIEMRRLAFQDHLTGLLDKILFCDRVRQAVLTAQREEKILAVLYLDLDGFEKINHTLGMSNGDAILIEVANRILGTIRKSDSAARTGNDDYLILAQNLHDITAVETVIQRITEVFRLPYWIGNHGVSLSASIGCALYPVDGQDEYSLIAGAESAMRQSKKNGGGGVSFCSTSKRLDLLQELKLTNRLYHALEREEMELFYQPQIDLQAEAIVGLEALLRWKPPGVGILKPDTFIPIAEKTGSIVQLGQWVMRTACRQNKFWQESFHINCPIAVNLSAVQFNETNLEVEIEDILKETGLQAKYLQLEITENISIKEIDRVSRLLEKLKKLGIRIAIDDFGIFYSSLNYLKKIPVDILKIDKSFIDGIGRNSKDEAIIKAIIALSKNLNLRVVAEGVETKSQTEFLLSEGCRIIQGYYFCEPMPAAELEKLFGATRNEPANRIIGRNVNGNQQSGCGSLSGCL